MTSLSHSTASAKRVSPLRSKHAAKKQPPVRGTQRRIGRGLSREPTTSAANDAASDQRATIDFSGLALFERLFLRVPVRLLRAGNNVLDLVFYDVHAIPVETRRRLLSWSDPDGSVLIVHPGDGNRREVAHFEHVEDFLASRSASELDAVAIAGVGSSALGTAALAANVADALGRPVIGIVSGYGLADALAEGLVGWFILRPANQLRQFVDACFAPLTPVLCKISADTQPNGDPRRLVAYVRGLPETDCLDRLLAMPESPLAMIVGHSKGNLCIATALDNLTQEQWQTLCPRLTVATLGALVHLPASLAGSRQFMGMLDMFGLMNSTLPQAALYVPWAMHTLNTRLPFHLAARESLANRATATVETAASFEKTTGRLVESMFDPGRAVNDWMDMVAGATTAISAACAESLRSLRQGADHATRATQRQLAEAIVR